MSIVFRNFLLISLSLLFFYCSPEETSINEPELIEENSDSEGDEETIDEESEDEENGNEDESTNEDDEENEDDEDDEDESEESSTTATAVDIYGQLSINGAHVVDKNGEAIQLRGMSLFWSQWSEGSVFYNANVVKWLVNDWKINIIRAAMGVEDSGGYISNPEIEKQKVFTVIDAAIEQGIYVIVDWHSHYAENYLEQSKAFFTEVAQKYGDQPNIIYEIYNEPLNVSWVDVLKPYHEAVIEEIRKYDPDNIVVCGTSLYSQRVDEVIGNEIDDENIAYTLHFYSSSTEHQEPLRTTAQTAINANIPIFVTEYGVSQYDGNGTISEEEAEKWWAFLDENKISWCNWSIANKDEASAALQPWASTNGNWTANDLSISGTMVKQEILSKNN